MEQEQEAAMVTIQMLRATRSTIRICRHVGNDSIGEEERGSGGHEE